MARKGKFKPKNLSKYLGNPSNIIYRSSWEFKLFRRLDIHPLVIGWSSESVIIPYRSPIDNKIHRYYPDVYMVSKVDGKIIKQLIEVKPFYQTQPPVKGKKKKKTIINEAVTYAVNLAKWEAAEKYCVLKGWEWKIMTENELNI